MKRVGVGLVVAVLMTGVLVVARVSLAQEEAQTQCGADALAAAVADAQTALDQAQAAASTGETGQALTFISEANGYLSQITDTCGGAVAAAPADALCTAYAQYCVPLVGGGSGDMAHVESPDVRTVTAENESVVRGVTADGTLFIGNPDAPVHILEFLDFACPHCIDYHETGVTPLIQNAVLTGQATFQVGLMAFVAGDYSRDAAYAMLCAGEQGAAWEMYDALFAHIQTQGTGAYSMNGLRAIGDELNINSSALVSCIQSGRYAGAMAAYDDLAAANGVTGTPTVLVRYGDSGEWTKVDRGYDALMTLIEQASAE